MCDAVVQIILFFNRVTLIPNINVDRRQHSEVRYSAHKHEVVGVTLLQPGTPVAMLAEEPGEVGLFVEGKGNAGSACI